MAQFGGGRRGGGWSLEGGAGDGSLDACLDFVGAMREVRSHLQSVFKGTLPDVDTTWESLLGPTGKCWPIGGCTVVNTLAGRIQLGNVERSNLATMGDRLLIFDRLQCSNSFAR